MPEARARKKSFLSLLLAPFQGGLIAAGTWYANRKYKDLKNELAEYILAHSESTAVTAYTFDEHGECVEDGYALFRNADAPLVVASTMKIIVLAAYADAVVNGRLDPHERVLVADLEKYYLPMSDGGAHAMGLKSLGLKSGARGSALDQTATLALDDLARIMIHYSGNAETDYLLQRIGADGMASIMSRIGLKHHTPIGSTLGVALAILNHQNSSLAIDPLRPLIADVAAGDMRPLNHWVELYLHDRNWRAAQIEFMTSPKVAGGVDEQEIWAYHTQASQLFPKGTAREYAHLLAKVASGQLISSGASAIMQQKLEGISSDRALRILFYDRFGAKDGVTAGVLALASYAMPKRGALADRSRVVVVLANQLPSSTWVTQVRSQGHYLLQTDLATASGVFGRFIS